MRNVRWNHSFRVVYTVKLTLGADTEFVIFQLTRPFCRICQIHTTLFSTKLYREKVIRDPIWMSQCDCFIFEWKIIISYCYHLASSFCRICQTHTTFLRLNCIGQKVFEMEFECHSVIALYLSRNSQPAIVWELRCLYNAP